MFDSGVGGLTVLRALAQRRAEKSGDLQGRDLTEEDVNGLVGGPAQYGGPDPGPGYKQP